MKHGEIRRKWASPAKMRAGGGEQPFLWVLAIFVGREEKMAGERGSIFLPRLFVSFLAIACPDMKGNREKKKEKKRKDKARNDIYKVAPIHSKKQHG